MNENKKAVRIYKQGNDVVIACPSILFGKDAETFINPDIESEHFSVILQKTSLPEILRTWMGLSVMYSTVDLDQEGLQTVREFAEEQHLLQTHDEIAVLRAILDAVANGLLHDFQYNVR